MFESTTYRVGDYLDVEVGYPDEWESATEYDMLNMDMDNCSMALIPTSPGYRTTGDESTAKDYLDALEDRERLALVLEDIEHEMGANMGANMGAILSSIENYATDIASNAVRLAQYLVIDVTGDRYTDYHLVVDTEGYRDYTGNCQPLHVLEKQLKGYAREAVEIINGEYTLVRVDNGDDMEDIRTNEHVDADNLISFLNNHGWHVGKRYTVEEV